MNSTRILVACIGNIFLGDDAFGVEVARRLATLPPLPGVRVTDFGIRGLDLTYALLEGYDAVILVDATPRGGAPGTLYLIEPDLPDAALSDSQSTPDELLIETHGMHPAKVLRLVAQMGGKLHRVWLVGCEPTPFDPEQDMEMELSQAVQGAIPAAIKMIEELVAKVSRGEESADLQLNSAPT